MQKAHRRGYLVDVKIFMNDILWACEVETYKINFPLLEHIKEGWKSYHKLNTSLISSAAANLVLKVYFQFFILFFSIHNPLIIGTLNISLIVGRRNTFHKWINLFFQSIEQRRQLYEFQWVWRYLLILRLKSWFNLDLMVFSVVR